MSRGRGNRLLAFALIFVFGVLLGALYSPVNDFLNRQFNALRDFVSGHPLEEPSSVLDKIRNDLGLAPLRAQRDAVMPADFDYRELRVAPGLEQYFPESAIDLYVDPTASVLENYAGMLVKTQADGGRGYAYQLVLIGFDRKLHTVIPLGTREDCDCDSPQALNYFHIDGDPAQLRQSGNQLVNVNSCGGADWRIESRHGFHHYLNSDGDHRQDSLWVLDATDLVELDTASGAQRQRLSLGDIINANPDLPIFEARLKGTRPDRWLYGEAEFEPLDRTHTRVENADHDPFHSNDIDAYLGDESGLFRRGDLVLSLRSLNLLVVVRPSTRKIIWYAYGLASRQHDPDFIGDDTIVVFDNNFHNRHSRILSLQASAPGSGDPAIGVQRRILLDRFEDHRFQQLTGGYQFFLDEDRHLVFTAGHYNAGVDLAEQRLFLALRHRWRDEAFLNLEIERFVSATEFDAIANARCH